MSISVPKVSPFCEEFGTAEHLLRIQLNAPSLKIGEMFDISLKPINVQFGNFVKSHFPSDVVDVFIPTKNIEQSKNDVTSHGLKIHQKEGFTFSLNCAEIDTSEKEIEIYHFKIALGSVLNYQDSKAAIDKVKYLSTPPTISNLETGYNSLRIGENKFVIFQPNQVKALHIIKFTWEDGVSNADPDAHVCDECHQPNATVYCHNDGKKLCANCDEKIHSDSEYLKPHKREPLCNALVKIQKCPEHQELDVLYYCTKCHLPICLDCKVKGSHAHGDAAKHKLIPIEQAYRDTLEVLKKPDYFGIEREKAIEAALQDCDSRLEEIRANQQSVEDEIMRVAMKAIEDARVQSSRTANQVKSAKIELLRKQAEFKDQKAMLKNFEENAQPVQLLEAFYRNACINKTMEGNLDLPAPLTQKGNLVVLGRIEVSPPKPETKEKSRASKSPVMSRGMSEEGQSYASYTYSVTESTVLEPKDPRWTRLSKMASKKRGKYQAAGINISFHPFESSRIILDPATAEKLYMCLPFKGTPEPHILYSTELHSKSIRIMHKMIDDMGISLVLVKSGDQVFGGFAASKWSSDGVPKKDKSSTFLFQLNKDAFIPFGGQSEDPIYMVATQDTLSFGGDDLKLAGQQFERCSSCIENSYGLGFLYNSSKAKEFMAGKQKFAADIVEVWGFFSSE
jgi:hypothetical protein